MIYFLLIVFKFKNISIIKFFAGVKILNKINDTTNIIISIDTL